MNTLGHHHGSIHKHHNNTNNNNNNNTTIIIIINNVMRYATSAALTHACMHVFLLKKVANMESPVHALKHGAGGLPRVSGTLGHLVGQGPDSGSHPAGGS